MTPTSNEVRPVDDSPGETRRNVLQAAALVTAGVVTAPLIVASVPASAQPAPGQSLYERLGGIFAIAGVVDYFSDEIIKDQVAGKNSRNPALRDWHRNQLGRLPGLKWMRTLWVAKVSGGPYEFVATRPGSTPLGLEEAHRNLKISPEEFDAVAAVLSRSLDHFSVPEREKGEVLAAFAAHKEEVTAGSREG
jgi:hemoglobin